jgi:hypothetical protein
MIRELTHTLALALFNWRASGVLSYHCKKLHILAIYRTLLQDNIALKQVISQRNIFARNVLINFARLSLCWFSNTAITRYLTAMLFYNS